MKRRNGLLALQTCMCVCVMTALCLADDPYAHPDGADGYGPRYEAREAPTEMKEVLDDQGRYAIPSFIDLTIKHGEQECWVIDQTPQPGVVVTCPQTVNVQLKYTCDGNDEHWARLPIELVDVKPPDVWVDLDSNAQPHVSFGGIERYLESAVVLPIITANDACGPQVEELLLNGQPYVFGTPIMDVGLHVLNVTAKDNSENRTSKTVIFEIRARPSHTAAAVVESTECTYDTNGDVDLA